MLDLTGAWLSFVISQLGQVFDDPIHTIDVNGIISGTGNAEETVEQYLRRTRPLLHAFACGAFFICGMVCILSTIISSSSFVLGFMLYLWVVQNRILAGLFSVGGLLVATVIGLFTLLFVVIAVLVVISHKS